ncbi:MAG: ABC transporter substrate-binding protein [Alishewanella sp.]|nr:ABC transporter substrate-binding protein [Alishewanella sp.]
MQWCSNLAWLCQSLWQSSVLLCASLSLAHASVTVTVNIDVAIKNSTSAHASMSATAVADSAAWQQVIAQGQNQPVYWHAWGGDPQVNQYIQWVGKEVAARYGIRLTHVKLADTGEAVSRILAEKAANNYRNGNVDLIWINGENFASLQQRQLLEADWAEQLPNFYYVNADENPQMRLDFGLPTLGMEAPWGQAQLIFYYNNQLLASAPRTMAALLEFSQQQPGRFTYPRPPDFLGVSFLKQLLLVLNQQDPLLYQPVTAASFEQMTTVLWPYLAKLHPNLWRQGRHFPSSGNELMRLVSDEELQLAFSFAPSSIPAAVRRYDLPSSTRSYAMQDGSLANVHFVAIPFNAAHSAAAKLVANFLLSPEAQWHKQQLAVWGDRTVLDSRLLNWHSTTQTEPAALPLESTTTALAEPHPSWSRALTAAWLARYGVQP